MLEKRADDEEPYIDDNCLIENEYYNDVKEMIKCKYCDQILKDPMMCLTCQAPFCKNCTKNASKKNNKIHKCKKPKYVENKTVTKTMGKLKYLCKNCKMEIKKENIEEHLNTGCEKNLNESKFMDSITRKKTLTKLSKEEIKKLGLHNKRMNHISGKIFLLIIFVLVILLGRVAVGKSSLINT